MEKTGSQDKKLSESLVVGQTSIPTSYAETCPETKLQNRGHKFPEHNPEQSPGALDVLSFRNLREH